MSQPFLFISKHREHLVCCVSGKRGIIKLKDMKHQILSFGTKIYKRILLLENYVWGKIIHKTLKKKKKKCLCYFKQKQTKAAISCKKEMAPLPSKSQSV